MNNNGKKYKTLIFLPVVFLLLNGCAINSRTGGNFLNDSPQVEINGKKIKVEIARTDEERARGLSGKKDLCVNCGLLFIFPEKKVRRFWMKNMNFPIDIIWIEDDKIVNISKNLLPEGDSPVKTYSSDIPANYVLEVNAGVVNEFNFKTGDDVKMTVK